MNHAFVIPAYGDSPYLPDCLDSILAQSLGGSRAVITTSTPSDYLDGMASRYKVPLLVNPHRGTIGSDWNFALQATDAELLTIAHQDDGYRADYLEALWEARKAVPDGLIAFSDYTEVDASGPRPIHLNIRVKRFLTRRAFGRAGAIRDTRSKRRMLAWGNPVCCPSVMIDRLALPDFRFVENLQSNLDWEAWRQLAERPGAFVYVRKPLAIRRIHAQSETSAAIADRRRLDEDRLMFERFWPRPIAALIMLPYRASYLANRS